MSKVFEEANIIIKASPTFRSSEILDLRLKIEDLIVSIVVFFLADNVFPSVLVIP